MEKPRIIVDADIPYIQGVLEPHAEPRYIKGSAIDHAACLSADALIVRTRTRCSPELLEGTPVRLIATATIGTDHIDTDYCQQRGIRVVNAPGCNAWAVVQWVLAAMLRINESSTYSYPQWTVGIVGHGQIGSRLQRVLGAFGVHTLLCDPILAERQVASPYLPLSRLARECDVITLHVPHTTQGAHRTHHLLDQEFFRGMLQHNRPYIINSSRGGVADDYQLLDALDHKRIRGYCLDVYEDEPDVPAELLERAIVATPHIAGYSVEGKLAGTRVALSAVAEHFGLGTLAPHCPTPTGGEKPALAADSLMELRKTYDIVRDSNALRAAPQHFERQRNAYAYRHDLRGFSFGNRALRELLEGELGV
ncbi:MAG: erythronate-4-phosphate dehydrogenase [Bacteroidia bacterium]|nr:MAG: erythronate-4-phosphate dehydrogenase [Bacteroidia bacterium]